MPNTPNGYPYPAGTDVPDVPRDVKALAEKLDAVLPFAQATGRATLSGTAGTGGTGPVNVAVTFPVGRFSVAPVMSATISNAPGGTGPLVPRVVGVTATGFTMYVYNPSATGATFTGLTVDWLAVQADPSSATG